VEVNVQLARRQIYAYLALGIVVAALGVRYLVLPRTASGGAAPALVLAAASPSPETATSPGVPAEVMVYVCGAVRRPGVVRLPEGARVADAIDLAGGPTGDAELSAVNLAAKVGDGQQIVVPERGASGAASGGAAAAPAGAAAGAAGTAAAPGALVNLNTASLQELETLSGVGPSTAQKIIDYRTANGGFTSIEQLMEVPGIGDAKFAAVKDSITI
jgi:competence protein ComEA